MFVLSAIIRGVEWNFIYDDDDDAIEPEKKKHREPK